MTAAFLLAGAAPAALAARLPPLIVALAAGAGVIAATGTFAPGLDQVPLLAEPRLHLPEFSWTAMVELVVPLAITVLVVQNGQGIAVLTAAGHAPPINAIAVACGAGSIVCAFVGCVSTCLTGPVNAIISSGGERKHSQYTAGVLVGAARRSASARCRRCSRACCWRRRRPSSPRWPGSPCCACCRAPSPSPSRAASRWARW